ncbi:hypothetical protein FGG08_000077 [Glutinoglossum americanum]|uniref:RWD domain-containing protein n=1 Tax=Glutinoglossum americanum TaxID=1670608 RepID=A0A9P8I4M1_9PEZI|nr:hypothetical protein FGG08_000077 [Glutinoglossum americanum]
MNEALQDEIEAINSIYGDGTVQTSKEENIYILHPPQQSISLRIEFPQGYPDIPPRILGSETSGDHTRKGEASRVVNEIREALKRTFRLGEVCLFDLLEDVGSTFVSGAHDDGYEDEVHSGILNGDAGALGSHTEGGEHLEKTYEAVSLDVEPPWVMSEAISERKSVFVARCAGVSTIDQAKGYLHHLISNNKKVANATHNITAWRIRGADCITYQDCDDDGEAAAGGRVLHLMQLMDVWDVMVVVTRWFRIINSVARDALARGGHVKPQSGIGSGMKKKREKK